MATGDQLLYQCYHLGYVVGSLGRVSSREEVDIIRYSIEILRVEFSDVPDTLAFLPGGLQHFVFAFVALAYVVGSQVAHVGVVAYVVDTVTTTLQHTAQRVGGGVGSQIADVGVVVDRLAAAIQGHCSSQGYVYDLLGFGQGIVELYHIGVLCILVL